MILLFWSILDPKYVINDELKSALCCIAAKSIKSKFPVECSLDFHEIVVFFDCVWTSQEEDIEEE